jgi:acetate kinase
MKQAVLILNAGSSSIKFALFQSDGGASASAGASAKIALRLCEGQIDHVGSAPHLLATDAAGMRLIDDALPAGCTPGQALQRLLAWIEPAFPEVEMVAAGHRVVHGGQRYQAPTVVDAAVLAELKRLVPLAPLHQPQAIAAIEALGASHPALVQIACFDTAFHHTAPEIASMFAIPHALTDEGVRRYGFHGLSYEFIAGALPHVAGEGIATGRVVVAHLGSGASMCALRDGKSVATTMGFTPLDGLPMSRRCGILDPGVVLYLLAEKGMSAADVTAMLYHDSGLYGISGISDDMSTLLASDAPRARQAVDLFVYRIGRELGSLAAALGGLDALVFTAGIGEHAAEIRRRVCIDAAWLGIVLDPAANAAGGPRISLADSGTSAWVIPTDEDGMIMQHCLRLLKPA